MWQGFELLDKL